MSEAVTDNSHRFLASLDALDRFRVTQVASFADCPRRWKANMLGEGEQKESPYAAIGTAVHLVVEQYLRGDIDFPESWHEVALRLEAAGVSPKERLSTRDYCLSLADRRGAILALEVEVELALRPYRVVGHIDCMFMEEVDGQLQVTIRDHKTNRQLKPVEWWAEQVQPRLYAHMVRRMLSRQGLCLPVYFELGYINLGVTHRWRTREEDDQQVLVHFAGVIEEFEVYRRTGEWPERVNEWCGYCPLKKTCEALPKSQTAFLGKLARRREEGESVAARYEFAKNCVAAMQTTADELKGELLALVTEHGDVQEGDTLYTARKGTRREVDASALWEEIKMLDSFSPEELDRLFSVKLTGLDQVVKQFPELSELLVPLVRTVESDEVTLSARKARK
jgi:hypothetical protein